MTATPPSGPRPDAPSPEGVMAGSARLARLARLSQLALLWERVWPALWPVAGVAMVYAAASLAGLWQALPSGWAEPARVLFLAAGLGSLWPLRRLRWPTRPEALARLDRSSPDIVQARIATSFDDAQAGGLDDPMSRALWRRHRQRLETELSRLRLRAPVVRMADHDRFALRAIPVLALVTAGFIAGPEWRNRLADGFSWTMPHRMSQGDALRLDGWIDPPRHTRRPPIMLSLSSGTVEPVKAPAGSILVIQAAGSQGLSVNPGPGLTPVADTAESPAPAGLERARFRIGGDSKVRVRAGGQTSDIAIQMIPDAPPKVTLKGKPHGGARGALTIAYSATDDYGIAAGHAEVRRIGGGDGRSLAEAPEIKLNLPANATDGAELRTVADLASHPWAGADVTLTLVVKDDAGQEGRSETVTVTLPERTFADPLARALVEQRRDLILTPDVRDRVQTALDALLIAPELFTSKAGVYLGLRRVDAQLRAAANDPALLDVAGQLWQLALLIEDGDLSEAEKQLRQAQQALRDGIERGAGEEEIRRLTQDMRRAMDRYVAEMGRQARSRASQPADPNARNISQDELQKLLDRIEELTREGRRDEAARLLDRLREIMENLQTASPSQGGGKGQQGGDQGEQGQAAQRLGKALSDLDELMRQQQALRDETFRKGQQGKAPQGAEGQGEDGANDEGANDERAGEDGAPGAGSSRPGQPGENAEPRQNPGNQTGKAPDGGGGALQDRQQALRKQLDAFQDRLKREGAEPGKGFGEAGEDMGQAGEALNRDNPGEAVDSQGRALEQLRRGAQDLARQMAEADGKGKGKGTDTGEAQDEDAGQESGGAEDQDQPGARGQSGAGPDKDPLGRPLRGQDRGFGQMEGNEGGEAASTRARRILDELRRRLGNREREREELDYLERLLGPR